MEDNLMDNIGTLTAEMPNCTKEVCVPSVFFFHIVYFFNEKRNIVIEAKLVPFFNNCGVPQRLQKMYITCV